MIKIILRTNNQPNRQFSRYFLLKICFYLLYSKLIFQIITYKHNTLLIAQLHIQFLLLKLQNILMFKYDLKVLKPRFNNPKFVILHILVKLIIKVHNFSFAIISNINSQRVRLIRKNNI